MSGSTTVLFETFVSVCHKVGVGRCNLEKSIVRRGLTLYYDAISKQEWKEFMRNINNILKHNYQHAASRKNN